MQAVTTIGLDIAKSVFQVHGRSPSHVTALEADWDLVPEVRWILRQSVEIYSVLHRLCSMLCQRLSTVTWLTQALPVAAIPEQPEISIVRYDVIHLCG